MTKKDLINYPIRRWPLLWCEINAKKHNLNHKEAIKIMEVIELHVDKKIILWFWNHVYHWYNSRKTQILEQIII